MQHSRSHDQSAGKPQSRRQERSHATPRAGDANPLQETTISAVLPSSKHGPGTCGSEDLPVSPSNKRQKRDHPFTVDRTSIEALRPENMNSCSAVSRPQANGALSLKGSSKEENEELPNFTPHTGARRLVVKNLRKAPRANPEDYFNRVWAQLDAALSAIFTSEKVPYSNEELYRGVENLCRQDKAPVLFQKLLEKCKHNVTTKVKEPLVAKARTKRNDNLLRAVVEAWSRWNSQLVIPPWSQILKSRD